MRNAKQAYLAGTLVLTPYDEKILQSWTYYGLPMYTLGDIVPDRCTTVRRPRSGTAPRSRASLLANTATGHDRRADTNAPPGVDRPQRRN